MLAAMRAEGEACPPAQAAAVTADATRLPFPDGAFDAIIVAEILEHVPDDTAAMNEIARVLRPGGTVAVTVPAWLPERICWALSTEYHEVPGGHVRIFTRAELTAKLAAAGLTPTGTHHAHGLHSPYWWLKCAVGVHDEPTRPCAATTSCWSGTSCASRRSPGWPRRRSTRSSARASSSTPGKSKNR